MEAERLTRQGLKQQLSDTHQDSCWHIVNLASEELPALDCTHTTNLCDYSCGDSNERKDSKDDQSEFPAVDEGGDDGAEESGHEEQEHSHFLSDAFLQLVEVPVADNSMRGSHNRMHINAITSLSLGFVLNGSTFGL